MPPPARNTPPHPTTASPHSVANRLGRVLWGLVQPTLFRLSPRPLFAWRNWLLRLFRARVDPAARVYPRAKVWAPWNLELARGATLADDVDCYCVRPIRLGEDVTVSQYSYLCGASHDHTDPAMPLTPAPIVINDRAWIAADVFVAPGVTIGEGCVIGARSSVFADTPPWTVCVGTPAKPIGPRKFNSTNRADP